MQASLRRTVAAGICVSLGAGVAATGYALTKFYAYENRVVKVMSGDQKSVMLGRLLGARVKASQELVQSSVENQDANEQFHKRLTTILDDLNTLSKDEPDKSLDESKGILRAMIDTKSDAKSEAVEDLFVHYRNLKTTAFNLYRMAWANKWMGVAKQMGLIINDLDNLPYQSADKAAPSVGVKIQQLVGLITGSTLPQGTKLYLFGQLGGLKTLVAKYNEALQKADALKAKRLEELKAVETRLQRYNDIQGKGLIQFGNEAHSEILKVLISSLLFVLFAFGWYGIATKRFAKRIQAVAFQISRQMAGWITTGGGISAQGFKIPEKPDAEFVETYHILDQTMKKMNGLRKEDILVKRLLNVPFLLVSKTKQAMFWNSALSILAKVRALEETGPMAYRNLLRFTDAQGRAIDPVEKAFAENKEVSQLALLRIGNDGIAVYSVCTPVMGPDNQPEYVMVHLRDLREENRRFEAELDRQLENVRTAIQQIKQGHVPAVEGVNVRRPVVECLNTLKAFSLELQEKATTLSGQVETMGLRMTREAELKKSVHSRMEQLKGEVAALKGQLGELKAQSESVTTRLSGVEARSKMLKSDYADIKKRGAALLNDVRSSQDLIGQALSFLGEAEEVSRRVRANERVVRSILDKSAMLNANNSILSSKRELTPSEVATVTENITQLLSQFERSYRFIEQSVGDVERSVADIGTRLRDSLNSCITLSKGEQAVLKAVYETEKLIEDGSHDVADFSKELATLRALSSQVGAQLTAVESKMKALVQIGKASIDLQEQLEIGFKGIFGHVGTPSGGGKDVGTA